MTSCARCGLCCRAIGVHGRKDGFQWLLNTYPERRNDPAFANPVWIVDHFQEISIEEAAAINFDAVRADPSRSWFRCDQFDAETNLCMAHESRPPLCSGFPWYDGTPNAEVLKPYRDCSFWADVPEQARPPGMRPLPSPDELTENAPIALAMTGKRRKPENCC